MADYSGEQFSLPTVVGNSNYWAGRWEFSLTKINSNTYSYSAKCYLQLTDSSKKARNTRGADDPYCAYLTLRIPELNIEQTSRGPYGPLIGGTGWQQYRDTLSGTFTVSSQIEIHPGFEVYTGYGSSMGTTLYAVDTWWPSLGTYTVSGVTKAVPSNPRCTGKTSSSISMTFDVDWGGEGTTFDPACTLLNASGNEIKVIRNGTTSGTFTGLTRYTKYYIRGYASNSAGGGYTSNVEVWTDPENPTINKPTVSNIGRLTATVTPGVVTDDGGKTITEVETYIKGGAFGNTLHSIGKGTSAKNVSGLEPNTMYQVITRATNGITESYSAYESFTTIGNPPTITDLYAKDVTTTNATIVYTATYDHNASFNKFVVQWRYPGSSTWTTLSTSNSKIVNVSNLNTDIIEYRITVTDNWNRSTTSSVLTYFMEENLIDLISNLKVTPNSDNTYTVSATWNQKVYNKLEYAYIFGKDEEQRSPDRIGTEIKSATGISIKTKAYKNNKLSKMFYLTVRLSCYRYNITKQITINSEPYSNAINIISKKAGNISKPMSTIVMLQNNYTQLKQLRQHDIIKLSRKMRYIYIDSRGYEDNKSIIDETVEFNIGKITAKININYMHLSGPIYQYVIQSLKLKTSNNSAIRIRNGGLILSIEGFTCASINDLQLNGTYQDIDVTQLSGNTFLIDKQSITFTPKITIKLNPEFDFASASTTKSLTSKTLSYANSDVVNNHLLEIQVFDNNGNNVSSGKDVKLSDGTNPICPYGTTTKSATNGITNNPNLSIYSNNGLPLVLDLGKEYNISKIKIWRKYNSSNVYFRNYIIGRNNNKELCYIFFDSKVTDGYIETSNGKEFIIK